MWHAAKIRDALRWPPKGAVVESLAIAVLKPVSGPASVSSSTGAASGGPDDYDTLKIPGDVTGDPAS